MNKLKAISPDGKPMTISVAQVTSMIGGKRLMYAAEAKQALLARGYTFPGKRQKHTKKAVPK